MDKNYFDFHFHPLAKHNLAPGNKRASDQGDTNPLTRAIPMTKAFKDFTDEKILRVLESQCCIDYLEEGKVNLGIAAISALEFGVASSKGYVSNVLNSNLKKPIDTAYFEVVKQGKVSYLNLFLKEIERYLELETENVLDFLNGDNTHRFNEDRINLMFAIEGGHNLSMKKIGNALEYDAFKDFEKNKLFDPNTVISKRPADVLEHLVKSMREKNMEVLYLTLAHLTHIPEQHLATQAYAAGSLNHPSFYPFGNGLTDLGKEVIDRAYALTKPKSAELKDLDKEKGKKNKTDSEPAPIFIDIAHMSLKSRQDFYEYRRANNYGKDLPLIASHVGVTGYSLNEWKNNLEISECTNHVDQGIKTVKIPTRHKVAGYWGSNNHRKFAFNSTTINLMDEDIINVVNSEGIIGVSLDIGVLGFESDAMTENRNYEFLTTADFTHHFPYTSMQALQYTSVEEILAGESSQELPGTGMHPLSLCFNIVHLLAVIGLKTNKKNPEDYICLGSDFDGFIEPVRICGDSRHLKDLEAGLLKWLPVAAREYQKENGGTEDLFELTKKKGKLQRAVRKILYANSLQFLGRHFPRTRSDKVETEPVLAKN